MFIFVSDPVIGMVCATDADCQNVLSNTVCTSLQCACAAGFSGSGNVDIVVLRVYFEQFTTMSYFSVQQSKLFPQRLC